MRRMQDQVDYLEASNKRMEKDLDRMDSLVTVSSDESRKTRAEVSSTLEDFHTEVASMRETVDELRRSIERHPPQIVYQAPASRDSGRVSSDSTGRTSPSDMDPSRMDSSAFLDVRKGNYELAISEFRDILHYFGETEYAPKAHYWIGECWYSLAGGTGSSPGTAAYDSAIVEFQYLVDKYPDSERIPTALYKLGRCHEELGRTRQARQFYQRVVDDFPRSLEAKPARSRLDGLR